MYKMATSENSHQIESQKLCMNMSNYALMSSNYQDNCVFDHTTQALKLGHTSGVCAEVQSSEDINKSINTHRST